MQKYKRSKDLGQTSQRVALVVLAFTLGTVAPSPGEDRPTREEGAKGRVAEMKQRIAADYDRLETLYKHLHANPELSIREARTAARLARELKALGFEVTENIGGHGIVGILKNGEGPTVLVRTDMDALPVVEQTGLLYASKVRTRDKHENEVGVMHACGHDMHITFTICTAAMMYGGRAARHGRGWPAPSKPAPFFAPPSSK